MFKGELFNWAGSEFTAAACGAVRLALYSHHLVLAVE